MEEFDDYEIEMEQSGEFERPPDSGIRMVDLEDLKQRATESKRHSMARVFRIEQKDEREVLKAHVDPFDTAIESDVA